MGSKFKGAFLASFIIQAFSELASARRGDIKDKEASLAWSLRELALTSEHEFESHFWNVVLGKFPDCLNFLFPYSTPPSKRKPFPPCKVGVGTNDDCLQDVHRKMLCPEEMLSEWQSWLWVRLLTLSQCSPFSHRLCTGDTPQERHVLCRVPLESRLPLPGQVRGLPAGGDP